MKGIVYEAEVVHGNTGHEIAGLVDHWTNMTDRPAAVDTEVTSLRAIKLWLPLKVFGADAFRQAVQRGIDVAERAAEMMTQSGRFESATGPSLAVVTFRLNRDGLDDAQTSRLQHRIVVALFDDSFAFVTSTELKGRTCLRFCTLNPRIIDDDLSETIERTIRFGDGVNLVE
ncbi:MAG: hypothetical protein GDA49_00480 [Rhodospirillales bacterium]|nr:hypothetical protein [Rhodospirillales bacterium]